MLLMGKSTISMAIFNSYVSLPEGSSYYVCTFVLQDTVLSQKVQMKFLDFPHASEPDIKANIFIS